MTIYPKNPIEVVNINLCSLNGKIGRTRSESTPTRHEQGITCDEDFALMERIVSESDAVFIGNRSMGSEKGAFSVAHMRKNKNLPPDPFWVIFTQSGQVYPDNHFWDQNHIPKIIFKCTDFNLSSKPQLSVESKVIKENEFPFLEGNINGLYLYLSQRGAKKAALFGGGQLNGLFWQHNLVDKLYLTISPVLIGGVGAPELIESSIPYLKQLSIEECRFSNGFVYLTLQSEIKVKK